MDLSSKLPLPDLAQTAGQAGQSANPTQNLGLDNQQQRTQTNNSNSSTSTNQRLSAASPSQTTSTFSRVSTASNQSTFMRREGQVSSATHSGTAQAGQAGITQLNSQEKKAHLFQLLNTIDLNDLNPEEVMRLRRVLNRTVKTLPSSQSYPTILQSSQPLGHKIPVSQVMQTLRDHGATTPYSDILIWNSGMSAARLGEGIRSFSQKHFGDPHALRLMRVCSDDDKSAAYRNQNDTDETLYIPGSTAQETYLNLDQFRETLIEAKKNVQEQRGPDAQLAVAVGWGYISENDTARQIADELGVIFIGPPQSAIASLGNKAEAKALAQQAGVPIIPGSPGVLGAIDSRRVDAERGLQEAFDLADEMGYPVLLKARSGGGGKGIRVVESREAMAEQFERASTEAKNAFGDEGLLLEKYLQNNRHIEFQLLADAYGDVVMLGERDCTLQNKHQKVIESSVEESRVPLDSRLKVREAVAELARASGYTNAGTAEFLYDEREDRYYFLEVNTRLQVEHIVTEQDWGLDLNELQHAIAMGIPMNQIFTDEQRDFFATQDHPGKHTIAVRITADDGWKDQGSTGKVESLKFPQNIAGLRYYTSVTEGSTITGNGDKQIGHLFMTADSREAAMQGMNRALSNLTIEGITTNVGFAQSLIQSDAFQNNNIHTKFLEEEYIPEHMSAPHQNPEVGIIARAIKLYETENTRQLESFNRAIATECPLPSIQRTQPISLNYGGNRYELTVSNDETRPTRYWVNGLPVDRITLHEHQERLQVPGDNGQIRTYSIHHNDQSLSIDSAKPMDFADSDPTRYEAFGASKLSKVMVKPGDEVKAGDVLFTVEAMKMEISVPATQSGKVVSIEQSEGELVNKGDLIVRFEPDAADAVETSEPVTLPQLTEPRPAQERAQRLLSGEAVSEHDFAALVNELTGTGLSGDASLASNDANQQAENSLIGLELLDQFSKRESEFNKEAEAQHALPYQFSRANLSQQQALISALMKVVPQEPLIQQDTATKAKATAILSSIADVSAQVKDLKPLHNDAKAALANLLGCEPGDAACIKTELNRSSVQSTQSLDPKRAKQASRHQVYVYDYPDKLASALQSLGIHNPVAAGLTVQELNFSSSSPSSSKGSASLVACDQTDPVKGGNNRSSVVIWEATIPTPNADQPTRIILGANDTTVANGAMGYKDSELYAAAANRAIEQECPFVFFFSGSGAKMVPNTQVGKLVTFNPTDSSDPQLYLHANDYEAQTEGAGRLREQVIVQPEPVTLNGERYYVLQGVHAIDNQASLSGCAKMISASIDASNAAKTPTLGVAVGPCIVGGQTYAYDMLDNTIQEKGCAVLLTGKEPINKGIGQTAYTNNLQLGGPQVHTFTGVSNQVANNFDESMKQVVSWLESLPQQEANKGAIDDQDDASVSSSFSDISEYSVHDHLGFPTAASSAVSSTPVSTPSPTSNQPFENWDVNEKLARLGPNNGPVFTFDAAGNVNAYDPRLLFEAVFDEASFVEQQENFAPNIVVGDAKIGGIDVGVIGFETRTTESVRASDPAAPKTPQERTVKNAGRVWDKLGSEKTARFIRTSNWMGKPLVIVPNIRGFKGDTEALLDGVIKDGSQIARELRAYNQPVAIWLPPHAQLRGGAWVVLDPNINPEKITFLADNQSTLGILEPDMMLPLSKVKREVESDKTRLTSQLGSADVAEKKATAKWRTLLTLADSPYVAAKDSAVDAVVDTADARAAIYKAVRGESVE